jgi:hypothetical protein
MKTYLFLLLYVLFLAACSDADRNRRGLYEYEDPTAPSSLQIDGKILAEATIVKKVLGDSILVTVKLPIRAMIRNEDPYWVTHVNYSGSGEKHLKTPATCGCEPTLIDFTFNSDSGEFNLWGWDKKDSPANCSDLADVLSKGIDLELVQVPVKNSTQHVNQVLIHLLGL